MKNSISFRPCFVMLVFGALALAASGVTSLAQAAGPKLRVGVYDSRVVAVAWANSTEFQEALKAIQADHKKARDAKNEKRVKEIEAQMQLRQRRAHEQGFSTGSVIPIMARVKDHLPEIARQAGVQIIVSKWELNYQATDVEIVDVTDKLVANFHVSARGLKWCQDIPKHEPLPIEQITEHMD